MIPVRPLQTRSVLCIKNMALHNISKVLNITVFGGLTG